MKLSVVISAYNEEEMLEDCLKSVRDIAEEIIVVDNHSTDNTGRIARKYTDKVFLQENDLKNIDGQKNFGFSKAKGDFILSLDADERVTPELSREIKTIIKNIPSDVHGYWIPRKNIIFGKWIEHTGWYPDKQLRLFRRGKGKFVEKHIHEMIKIDGNTQELKEAIYHLNYVNLSQFLDKMIRIYTVSEAENLIRSGYAPKASDAIIMPTQEFIKRFFAEKGYKDGAYGLYLSLLMAVYHLIVFLRVWEKKSYPDEKNILSEFGKANKESVRQIKYWMHTARNENEKNPIKKISRKILQKVS